jgi:UDP-2,3-diacylglucosamine hydrolase
MDVNQAAVETAIRAHKAEQIIHGHTHRPAIHHFLVDGCPKQRIVLGDWSQGKSVLTYTRKGLSLS